MSRVGGDAVGGTPKQAASLPGPLVGLLLILAAVGGLPVPASAQSPRSAAPAGEAAKTEAYAVTYGGGGPGSVGYRIEQENGEEEGEGQHQIRVVVTSGESEPMVYEWKTSEGESVQLPSGEWAFVPEVRPRGFLGVQLLDLTPELRRHFGASEDVGVLIGKVEEESPAQRAGLRVGDVLSAVDGEKIASSREVRRHVGNLKDGEVVSLTVVRDRTPLELTATVVEKERPEVDIRTFVTPHVVGGAPLHVFDESEIAQNLKELEVRFSNPDFQNRIHTLRSLESELEKRISELEKRLAELEKKVAAP